MSKVDLSTYRNEGFNPGSAPKRAIWYLVSLLFFQSYFVPFYGFKAALLRLFGAKVGEGVVIKPAVRIKYPWKLRVGDHVWIGEGVWIDNLALVTLGSHVCLSQGAMLLTGNHNYRTPTFDLMVSPIDVEEGAWIGAQALVAPGVHCGSHSVLTAGSAAHGNLQPYGIYTGVPATFVKRREIA